MKTAPLDSGSIYTSEVIQQVRDLVDRQIDIDTALRLQKKKIEQSDFDFQRTKEVEALQAKADAAQAHNDRVEHWNNTGGPY